MGQEMGGGREVDRQDSCNLRDGATGVEREVVAEQVPDDQEGAFGGEVDVGEGGVEVEQAAEGLGMGFALEVTQGGVEGDVGVAPPCWVTGRKAAECGGLAV